MSSEPHFAPVSHVVFDMDGLLLDTETIYEKAITNVCQNHGKHYTMEMKIKITGIPAIEEAKLMTSELNLGISPEQYLAELDQQYVNMFNDVKFMPGAERLVRHLHKHNIPIAIATSSKRYLYDMKTKNLKPFFQLFHHIVFSSEDPEVKNGKPAPDPYLVAVSRFDTKPESMINVLVLEDAPAGVQSALSAGCQVVWVPDPSMPRNLAKPTLTLDSLIDLRPELFCLPVFD